MNTGQANNNISEFIPTRQSLLERLRNWNDQESWKVFFDTYWKLIYTTAMRAGLSDAEAQDVVQETVISVLNSMPTFEYDSAEGSFKKWLMRLTRWRIADQIRARGEIPDPPLAKCRPSTATETGTEEAAEPALPGLDATWEQDWEINLMEAAIERVKAKVDAKQYQVFDLYALKNWPVSRVAQALQVNAAWVYVAKHRISKLIKKEIAQLKAKPY